MQLIAEKLSDLMQHLLGSFSAEDMAEIFTRVEQQELDSYFLIEITADILSCKKTMKAVWPIVSRMLQETKELVMD